MDENSTEYKKFKQALDKAFEAYEELVESEACTQCKLECSYVKKNVEVFFSFIRSVFNIASNTLATTIDIPVRESRMLLFKALHKNILEEEINEFIESTELSLKDGDFV